MYYIILLVLNIFLFFVTTTLPIILYKKLFVKDRAIEKGKAIAINIVWCIFVYIAWDVFSIIVSGETIGALWIVIFGGVNFSILFKSAHTKIETALITKTSQIIDELIEERNQLTTLCKNEILKESKQLLKKRITTTQEYSEETLNVIARRTILDATDKLLLKKVYNDNGVLSVTGVIINNINIACKTYFGEL